MSLEKLRQGTGPVVLVAWLALLAAGLVLATSFLVDYPGVLVYIALLIALEGMTTVVASAWQRSRATGRGVLASLGPSLKPAWRFVLDFF
ncbi:hypothetical protein [Knoellia sp. p5-6-4]|uniref:hypothetical protein n=1 Tax=unclassified Knoellia TaxID=2618719 RepID=UPI0023DA7669|nr:hypothetical protein [Knoellia sp. p5-6-4]MDF2146866.1 hypothetical protein [Knoellia sp. p5-6-4]